MAVSNTNDTIDELEGALTDVGFWTNLSKSGQGMTL